MFLPQQSVKQGIKKGPMCSNHDYAFRCYVISHLPSLLVLDDHAIDADEREEARKVYGNRRVSVSSKKVSKKHKEKVSNLANLLAYKWLYFPCLQGSRGFLQVFTLSVAGTKSQFSALSATHLKWSLPCEFVVKSNNIPSVVFYLTSCLFCSKMHWDSLKIILFGYSWEWKGQSRWIK